MDIIDEAIYNNYIRIVRYLANEDITFCTDPEGYIKYSAKLNRIEMIEFLFDKFYIDIFYDDQIFIDNGANIKKYGKKLYIKAKKIIIII